MAKWVENVNELNKIASNSVADIYISVADLQSAYDEQGAEGIKTLLSQRGINTFSNDYSASENISADLVTTASSILVSDETATGLTTLYMSEEEVEGVPFIKFSAMPENDNTGAGSATTLMDFRNFATMVLTATGLGWQPMNDYPEYWNAVQNRYMELGGSDKVSVEIRETVDGTKVYANSKDISATTKAMAEQGSYDVTVITTDDMPTESMNELTLESGSQSLEWLYKCHDNCIERIRSVLTPEQFAEHADEIIISNLEMGANLIRSRFSDKIGFYKVAMYGGWQGGEVYHSEMYITVYTWPHNNKPTGSYNATTGLYRIKNNSIIEETFIRCTFDHSWSIASIATATEEIIPNKNIRPLFEVKPTQYTGYIESLYNGRPFSTITLVNGNPATPDSGGTSVPIISAREAESETTGAIEQLLKESFTDWPTKGYNKPSISPSGVGTLGEEEMWPLGTTTTDPNETGSQESTGTPTQGDIVENGGKPIDVGNEHSNSSVTTPSAEASTNAFNPYYPPSPNIGDKHPVDAYTGGLMFNAHVLSKSKLDEIGALFWQPDFITQIINYFAGDPLDTVIGCLEFFCDVPTSGSSHVYWGPIRSAGVAPNVGERYFGLPCGTVNIPNYYNDARDYSPFAKAEIYLPFIGWQSINVEDIMGATVEVHYAVDAFTGACLASIYSTKDGSTKELYSFTGVCGASLPLTGTNHNSLIGSIINTTVGVAKGVLGGDPIGTAGSVLSGAVNIASGIIAPAVNRSGAFNGNTGAMGHKKPYIVVTRKVAYDAGNYNKFYGYPANITRRLDSIIGYARVKSIHLDNIVCTDDEKSELDRLLKAGVIF